MPLPNFRLLLAGSPRRYLSRESYEQRKGIEMTPLRIRIAALCFSAAVALPGTAVAQDGDDATSAAETKENPVVAVVNGEEIRYQDVIESARQLPAQYQQQLDRIFPALVDRLVDMELVGDAAQKAGLEDSEAVQERMAELQSQIVREVYLQNHVDDYITEERLQQAYEDYKNNNPSKKQVKASHILVEDEETAKKLIEKLGDGAEFAKLAQENSTGPSGSKGGDLGFFAEGEMVPAFSDAAFSLDVGEVTEEPVKTQFGWHIIKVTDTRMTEPNSFEEMESQLREQLQQEAVQTLLADLREDAKVETYPERRKQVEEEPDLGSGQGQDGVTVAPGAN